VKQHFLLPAALSNRRQHTPMADWETKSSSSTH